MRRSAGRKEEVVLRLLRGESLDLLARETGQPAGRIATWREEFWPLASVAHSVSGTSTVIVPSCRRLARFLTLASGRAGRGPATMTAAALATYEGRRPRVSRLMLL